MWHKTFVSTFLVLMTLCVCACEQKTSKPDVTPVATSPDFGAGGGKVPDAPTAPQDDSLTAKMDRDGGKACLIDEGCAGYLRCIQRVCTVPPAISGERDEKTPEVVFRDGRDVRGAKELSRFYVELASDNKQRTRGLMYRRSMQPDWGMIFIYSQERPLSFWMKNTYISLDMVFINASGEVVGVIEEVEPLTLDPRAVPTPARYVLELGAGVASSSGIKEGVWMDILKPINESQRPIP